MAPGDSMILGAWLRAESGRLRTDIIPDRKQGARRVRFVREEIEQSNNETMWCVACLCDGRRL
eukprot:3566559-Pyramimonas_sp.AAC.1